MATGRYVAGIDSSTQSCTPETDPVPAIRDRYAEARDRVLERA